MPRKLKLFSVMILIGFTLIVLPAKAEWEWTSEYLKPKFQSLIKSSIEKGKIKVAKEQSGSGTPLDSYCNSIEITGISAWSDGEPGYGKPYYIWSTGGMTVECWELIKKGMPSTPFNLVKGVGRSKIEKVVYFPFSDPGPSIFFYFAKESK